jgi:hypothetical protein
MQKLNEGVAAGVARNVINCGMALSASARSRDAAMDEGRMREIYEFTARTLKTARPSPFGALIVNTKTGGRLMRATNAVMHRPAGLQETETPLPCRVYDVLHLRALPDVHGQCAVGQA